MIGFRRLGGFGGVVFALVCAGSSLAACKRMQSFNLNDYLPSRDDAGATASTDAGTPRPRYVLLRPARVFTATDDEMHADWVVLVHDDRVALVGKDSDVRAPDGAEILELPGATLMPGLIEAHSHLLLHPYDETKWNDQVLTEAAALRVARATNHARATLLAGFTTVRDLGTEGAGYADVGLKKAIEQNIIPGPRMYVTTRAIVATGSYGPKGFAPEWAMPLGAEEADGIDALTRVVRSQIGHGADWVKVYADAPWGPNGETRPTFSEEELTRVVEVAKSAGRPVAAHAMTIEGMRRAIRAGVETIEHGDQANAETFRAMKERDVAYCPTLSATEAILKYRGFKKGVDPEPNELQAKRAAFKDALAEDVVIAAGSDVGVFAHGDEARELELMVEYGMKPLQALKAATVINAKVLHADDRIGTIKPGQFADLIAVYGDPLVDIRNLRAIRFVMKNGIRYLP